MNGSKIELLDKIKSSNNVLITVNRNPSLDQLAAGIGLSLLLNKLDKHATTVFSGEVPKILDFLDPDKNIEPSTDSLRDFIISLDKEKADKLKYKLEGDQVRIFITPYKTSITEDDLSFSQGDFNVDLVILLGALSREELDQAIVSHGRILHDATIATIGTDSNNSLGSINYYENSSSISEILAHLSEEIQPGSLDNQIANAYLTGIVAETDRFSNDKTTSSTLAISSQLVAAGANQQLVASKLAEKNEITPPEQTQPENNDGKLVIEHQASVEDASVPDPIESTVTEKSSEPSLAEIEEANRLGKLSDLELPKVDLKEINNAAEETNITTKYVEGDSTSPMQTANQKEEELEPPIDVLSGKMPTDLMTDNKPTEPVDTTSTDLNSAQQAVDQALLDSPQPIKPIESLNAQPVIEIDHGEINEDHEISIDDNGQITLTTPTESGNNVSNLSTSEEKLPYETTIQPLHDLKKNVLDEAASDLNSPPPVPPPIPM